LYQKIIWILKFISREILKIFAKIINAQKELVMQTMNLQIEDSFFPHFKAMIDSFVNDRKVQVVDDSYDYENNYPQSVVVSSIEEVRRRVFEAEKRIEAGDFITEEEYEIQMNNFFKEELGIAR
jgi:hypothetical protein